MKWFDVRPVVFGIVPKTIESHRDNAFNNRPVGTIPLFTLTESVS